MKFNHSAIQKFIRWVSVGLFLFACAYKFKRIIDNANGKDKKDDLPPNNNDVAEPASLIDDDDDDDDDLIEPETNRDYNSKVQERPQSTSPTVGQGVG